ncbi:MAG: branched-chain amino acid aminotransferase [Cryomorphaceae bacterium]|nr:MAG: branched-chain amino acid aminotransferase [Cryomorphaceae bacterium]
MLATDIKIRVKPTPQSRLSQLDFDNLRFGREFSDHMFQMDYKDGQWQNAEIVPFANLSLNPATAVLHYGQSIFEGMKAYKGEGGQVILFRPEANIRRMNISAERMCMPAIPEGVFRDALVELMKLDAGWVPQSETGSLYIRPFLFATDEFIGVKPGESFRFMIFTCPVNAYYTAPVRVKIEMKYARATPGGTGYAKAAGNYAASLYPARLAQKMGYDQLVWTDALTHKYIEESGTMNVFFVTDEGLMTPPLGDTILAGITRDSVLTLARDWGVPVVERRIGVDELVDKLENGKVSDAFGAGTAATIAHIATIGFEGKDYDLPPVGEREFSNKVLTYLNNYRKGRLEDKFNWNLKV